ncbi:hypothetical protein HYPSUDRAFT_207575 [Hypholoma sublateritium FD-334 SS-4]|uniref:Uncharacterized protein n=1 Tax=Hypholoma sublateritium (strain FD-334 SS-4) TaxID=945553 RepID=A0A0D2NGJ4_HYPSF|nr:hypothetical protein HYPSUDRAFT_207575 [Hypholoma sublateritium FD-334 SS-4]
MTCSQNPRWPATSYHPPTSSLLPTPTVNVPARPAAAEERPPPPPPPSTPAQTRQTASPTIRLPVRTISKQRRRRLLSRHGPPSSPPSVVPPPAHTPRHRWHPPQLSTRRRGAPTAVHSPLDATDGVIRNIGAHTGPIARPEGLTAPAGTLSPPFRSTACPCVLSISADAIPAMTDGEAPAPFSMRRKTSPAISGPRHAFRTLSSRQTQTHGLLDVQNHVADAGPFGYEHRGCSAHPFSQHPTPLPVAASRCSTTTTRRLPDARIATVAAIRIRPGPRAPLAAPNPDPLLDSQNNIAKGVGPPHRPSGWPRVTAERRGTSAHCPSRALYPPLVRSTHHHCRRRRRPLLCQPSGPSRASERKHPTPLDLRNCVADNVGTPTGCPPAAQDSMVSCPRPSVRNCERQRFNVSMPAAA